VGFPSPIGSFETLEVIEVFPDGSGGEGHPLRFTTKVTTLPGSLSIATFLMTTTTEEFVVRSHLARADTVVRMSSSGSLGGPDVLRGYWTCGNWVFKALCPGSQGKFLIAVCVSVERFLQNTAPVCCVVFDGIGGPASRYDARCWS